MQDGVELGILGDLEVTGPSGPIMLGAAKERLLLAVLAVDRQRAVSRDRLVDELWDGDRLPRSAVNALQNYVLRLRRALATTHGLRIATVPGGYRLEAADGRVDADRAERLVTESRTARPRALASRRGRLLGARNDGLDAARGPRRPGRAGATALRWARSGSECADTGIQNPSRTDGRDTPWRRRGIPLLR